MSLVSPKAIALLEHSAPAVSESEAEQLLLARYGIKGAVTPLVSERDLNFRVRIDDGFRLLKFSNAAEPMALTDFQTAVMAHLREHCPNVSAPYALPDSKGNTLTEYLANSGESNAVRLLHWVPGVPVRDTQNSAVQAQAMGDALARIDLGLMDFSHPAERPDLLWDMQQCDQLLSFADSIADPELRTFCDRWLKHLSSKVLPLLGNLRSQVIYNDLNHSNVLAIPDAPDEIAGVIDFGDVVRAPLVIDAAVACAYLCETGSDPYQKVRSFLAGYEAIQPLELDERRLLHELIQTRMVMTIVITNWRASRHPQNRDYILRNEAHARKMLLQLNQLDAEQAFIEHLHYSDT